MRIAALTSTDPQRHYTWHLRVAGLMPHLAEHGIEVVPQRLPKNRSEFAAAFAALPPCDALWLHRRILWPSEMRALKRLGLPIVLDIDDPVGLSASAWQNFCLKNCLQFRATAKHVDAVFAATTGLVKLAQAHNANVHHVRLSADTPIQRMRAVGREPGEPLRLLWLGARSTFVYLKGVTPHLEAIGQACPNARLLVVGHEDLQLQHLPVENVRWSRATERHGLETCHVGLVPMPRDRWTQAKAAFKPLQYLANGLPFLASPVGVNLDLAGAGRNGILADSPAEWAQAVKSLEADEPRRFRMGCAGVDTVRQHHAPEVLAAQVARLFEGLTVRRVSARAS